MTQAYSEKRNPSAPIRNEFLIQFVNYRREAPECPADRESLDPEKVMRIRSLTLEIFNLVNG